MHARATRPLTRRVFPDGSPPREAEPLPAGEELWHSGAFLPSPVPAPETRLAAFHAQYGEDVLAAARAGETARAQALVDSWIETNPPRRGDAWHPYPLSTRVGNWLAARTLVPELASARFSASLWRQLRHLELNVEDDILGNHVIRNARALVLGGLAFGSERLLGRGLRLLERELPEQVLPDGGHYERAPAYHLLVLRDLLEVQAVAPQPWLGETIERMRRVAAALQRPDGEPALFNDGWVGLGPRLDLPEPQRGVTVLRESGFVVVREGPLWLAFRCGPLAPEFLPAHAHADALSFQLWWGGEPIVVDPGTATYEPGSQRDRERSTAAHATVCVDERSQFEPWGAFRSGPLPRVELLEAREGLLEAGATYRGVRHVRRLTWEDGCVAVADRVEGRGRHVAVASLSLAPEASGVRVETRTPLRVEGELPLELGYTLRLADRQ